MLAELKKLTKHSIIYGIGSVLSRGLRFLLIPLYAHYLNPNDYGLFALIATTGNVLSMLGLLGLSTGMFREVIFKESDEKVVTSTAFLFLTVDNILFFGPLLVLAPQLSAAFLGDRSHYPLLQLVLVSSAFHQYSYLVLAKLRIHTRSVLFSTLQILQFLLSFGLNVLFIVGFGLKVEGLIFALLAVDIVFLAINLMILVPDLTLRFSVPALRGILTIGIPSAVFGVAEMLMTSADRYILESYHGLEQVGLYAMSYNVGLAVQLLVSAVQLAWPAQMFAIAKKPDAESKLARIFTYYAVFMAFAGLGLALLAREVLAILAPRYAEAAGVIPYIVASYLFFGGVYMTNIALDVKAKSKYMIPIMVSAVALNMALNYLLIPGYGMQGAAWSTLISYLYLFAVQLRVNQRVWRIPYEYGRLLKIVVVWLVILGSGQFMNSGRPAIDILFKLVLLANYPLLLYALRFFSSSEIDAGRRLFKSALSRLPFAHASRPSHS